MDFKVWQIAQHLKGVQDVGWLGVLCIIVKSLVLTSGDGAL